MKLFRKFLPLLFSVLTLPVLAQTDYTAFVNPLVGSAPSTTPSALRHSEAGNESKGQIVPAIGFPQGMTTWTPQTRATEKKCIPPFYYNDSLMQGIRGTHWMNGSCVQDYGSFTFMPLSGSLRTLPNDRASAFDRRTEVVQPNYYAVTLRNGAIRMAVTGTERCGFLQFDYQEVNDNYLVIQVNSDEGEGYIRLDERNHEMVGYNPVHRIYQGSGQPAGFSGHFVVRWEGDAVGGVWQDNETFPDKTEIRGGGKGGQVGAYLRFNGKSFRVKVGTSFTSEAEARRNLDAEIPHRDFERTKSEAKAAWNEALGKVEVKGNDYDKRLFYTALYHAKLTPRIFSDVSGTYPGFADDSTVHRAEGFVYYDDFNLWDTYRAVHPLHVLLAPKMAADMVNSLIVKAEQGGWLPIFPCWNQYTAAMIGDHAIAAIADAYVKGITGVDYQKAYKYMRKNAFEPNPDPQSYEQGKGRRALSSYLRYNYIPLEDSVWQAFHKREQVSRTLEYAYDDFALAQVAKGLGYTEDYVKLMQRAGNYRNVIDPAVGWARGRYADGTWVTPFNPFASRSPFITEGSPAQYSFYVPQDVAGLMQHMGGESVFRAKLDTLFDYGHYWHGNEPNNQIAYLYAYTNEPHKAADRIRNIIREEYTNEPGGLSGNEDGGQMSAWLVFSMMGFYPVCPATNEYAVGQCSFRKLKLHLTNGHTTVIKKREMSPNFLKHNDLLTEKTIKLR